MKAVIFDIYGTLLRIEPTPRAAADWLREIGMTRENFLEGVRKEISLRHAAARAKGVSHPEIQWPEVVEAVAPGVCPALAARFERKTSLQPGAEELLRWLQARSVPLGLASNAQAYTLDELRECGIEPERFYHRFLSFEQGFSKPDPEVFHRLARDFSPLPANRILVVGDRLDNDILPARAAGFQTWQVGDAGLNPLRDWLKSLV